MSAEGILGKKKLKPKKISDRELPASGRGGKYNVMIGLLTEESDSFSSRGEGQEFGASSR